MKLSNKVDSRNQLFYPINNLYTVQQPSFHSKTSANLMAQPAVPVNDDWTDLLGISPFRAKASINPPFLWELWIGQFFLAAGLKDNINPHDLLVEPAEVLDEPPPRPETIADGEDAGAADARRQRDQAAVQRVNELNIERKRKGPRISQNWFYHKTEARMKSRLFFALGNEGKRRFADSFPHTDISNIPFQEFHNGCETLFKVEQEYTAERIKLYNTVFKLKNDTFSSFYARLSAQVALCNLPQAQESETLKDLFIGRIRDIDVQQQLIKAKADLDGTFKLALECEKGANTSAQFQSYFLIINIQMLSRLIKNLLSPFSRAEGKGIIL